MANYEDISSLIDFNNHSVEIEGLFNQYYEETKLDITVDDVEIVLSYIDIPDKIKMQILKQFYTVFSDKKAVDALRFIRLITVEKAHPSQWYLNNEPKYETTNIKTGIFSLYSIISIAVYMINVYRENNIDEKHIAFNLGHLQGFIKEYYEANKEVGIANYTWCIYLASLGLIHLHTLHFMHHVFSEPCIVFKSNKTNEKVMLALDGIDVRVDGQINNVNNISNFSFKTIYKETKTSYIGHRVNPYGAITNDIMILSKLDYDIILQQGDYVIDYHIPTGPGYTIENMKESFIQAIDFFNKVYKEYDYKAFWCLSWLSSPQIPFFVKNNASNIYRINQQSYTFPAVNGQKSILKFVFNDENIDVLTVIPKTSLETGILDYNLKGKKINCGVFLYFLEDIDGFGKTLHRTEKDFTEFLKLNK